MAEEAYFLSQEDRDILAQMAKDYRRRTGAGVTSQDPPRIGYQPPEVYVARAPAGGIPAMTIGTGTGTSGEDGHNPGWAECVVYGIDDPRDRGSGTGIDPRMFRVANVSRVVYNLTEEDVPAWAWLTVVRDKFGKWIVVSDSAGTGASENRVRWIKVITNSPDSGYYPGYVRELSGVTWSDGERCRVVKSEGDCFLPLRIYKGKFEYVYDKPGTGTGTSSGIDVYSCSGNDKHLVSYSVPTGVGTGCEDRCDMWFLPAPFQINENIGCSGTGAGTSP